MGIITSFLNRLLQFGTTQGFFIIEKINTPSDTCCPSVNIDVINFDKTKVALELAIGSKFNVTKSCDALKFMLTEERLDFIEYKRLQLFINNDLKHILGSSNRKEIILEKIQKFDFSSKIYDSIFLLEHLTRNDNFSMTKDEKSLLSKIPINYIVLIDIDLYNNAVDYICITLTLLGTNSANIEAQVTKTIEEELDKISENKNYWNIQKPLLKNCQSIVSFYS